MISQPQRFISPIAEDVWRGLTAKNKWLSPWLLYDRVGSELFDEITRLPEYYLTRTERGILEKRSAEIVAAAGRTGVRRYTGEELTLIELGAGTAEKTSTVIEAILKCQKRLTFYPVDVSPDALQVAVRRLTSEFGGISVKPIVTDYTAGLDGLSKIAGRKLVLYIGSSIGNFEPLEAAAVLARVRKALAAGDALLVGTDMVKEPSVMTAAYDDAQGVTARFNLNLLARINRELGGHFELEQFRHVALWNAEESRMEMHLESVREQTVAIDDLQTRIHFRAGERIHTENSYKFTMEMVCNVLQNAGFGLERTWTDEREWFGLHLARVRS